MRIKEIEGVQCPTEEASDNSVPLFRVQVTEFFPSHVQKLLNRFMQPGQKPSLNRGLTKSVKPMRALGAVWGIRKIEAITIEHFTLRTGECKERNE